MPNYWNLKDLIVYGNSFLTLDPNHTHFHSLLSSNCIKIYQLSFFSILTLSILFTLSLYYPLPSYLLIEISPPLPAPTLSEHIFYNSYNPGHIDVTNTGHFP